MLEVMRDPKVDTARRDAMAKAAALYSHPRLQSVLGGEAKPRRIIYDVSDDTLRRVAKYAVTGLLDPLPTKSQT
jgi:hypothetical protein